MDEFEEGVFMVAEWEGGINYGEGMFIEGSRRKEQPAAKFNP